MEPESKFAGQNGKTGQNGHPQDHVSPILGLDSPFPSRELQNASAHSQIRQVDREMDSAKPLRMLDLFCGRGGWTNAFLARGWECVGIDINPQPEYRGKFIQRDVMELTHHDLVGFDFVCASSPCEQFSVHGMKHFHPNPPYPEEGIRLFNGTRYLCEASGKPYVMENVRAAQKFIGKAVHHCGPFYLWGNGVPLLMAQGISKGIDVGSSKLVKRMTPEQRRTYRAQFVWNQAWSSSTKRMRDTAKVATIPPELANCVADYAERILCKP